MWAIDLTRSLWGISNLLCMQIWTAISQVTLRLSSIDLAVRAERNQASFATRNLIGTIMQKIKHQSAVNRYPHTRENSIRDGNGCSPSQEGQHKVKNVQLPL